MLRMKDRFWISDDEDDEMQSIRGIAMDRRLSGVPRRESSAFARVSRKATAIATIAERRKKYEAVMLEDKHLLRILSVVHGPKSQTDSMALLKGVRMSQEAPYQSLQTAADYINEFKETVKWISGTEYGLSNKTMIKQFIKGVNPAKFREELELLEIESFTTLEDRFNDIYYEHHERVEKLLAAECMVAGSSNKERAPAEKPIGERGRGTWRGQGQERVASDVSADGTQKTGTPPAPQKKRHLILHRLNLSPKKITRPRRITKPTSNAFIATKGVIMRTLARRGRRKVKRRGLQAPSHQNTSIIHPRHRQ